MPRLILLLTLLASGVLIAQEHDSDDIPPIEEIHRQLLDVLLELEYLKLDHFKYDEATENLAWELATDVEAHRRLSGAAEYDRVRELRQERIDNILSARTALEADQQEQTYVYTLYRDSVIAGLRVHMATFDVDESNPTYNQEHCEMMARVMNANVQELGLAIGGYWCEPGYYRENGNIPIQFEAEFPTVAEPR